MLVTSLSSLRFAMIIRFDKWNELWLFEFLLVGFILFTLTLDLFSRQFYFSQANHTSLCLCELFVCLPIVSGFFLSIEIHFDVIYFAVKFMFLMLLLKMSAILFFPLERYMNIHHTYLVYVSVDFIHTCDKTISIWLGQAHWLMKQHNFEPT